MSADALETAILAGAARGLRRRADALRRRAANGVAALDGYRPPVIVIASEESAIEEMKRLEDGDPISVAGEFDCQTYAPAGAETRLSWTIRADAVLSARAKRKPKANAARAAPPMAPDGSAPSPWDDPGYAKALDEESYP